MKTIDYNALPEISHIILDLNDKNQALIKLNDEIIHEQNFIAQYYSTRENCGFQYKNVDNCLELIKEIKKNILSQQKSFVFKYSRELHISLYGSN